MDSILEDTNANVDLARECSLTIVGNKLTNQTENFAI